jgi:hypothetical protein
MDSAEPLIIPLPRNQSLKVTNIVNDIREVFWGESEHVMTTSSKPATQFHVWKATMKDVWGVEIGIRGETEVVAADLKYATNDELFGWESRASLADEDVAILSSYEIFNMTNKSRWSSIESFRGIK